MCRVNRMGGGAQEREDKQVTTASQIDQRFLGCPVQLVYELAK